MPEKRTTAEVRAEAGTEGARQFVRRVRRVTRRKFTPEEKVRIVVEGFRGELRVSELCRRVSMKSLVAVVSLAAAVLLASACGGGAAESTATPTATPTVAVTPSPTAEATAAPSPTATPGPPATGKIAFVSTRDGNFEIYVMNADGSDQIRLTDDPGFDVFPIWSPAS